MELVNDWIDQYIHPITGLKEAWPRVDEQNRLKKKGGIKSVKRKKNG